MGNKIAALILSLFVCAPVFAQHIPPIPEATLKAAGIDSPVIEMKRVPDSAIVRAAIGDNAFKNYTYSEISVFGTKEILVWDGANLVGKYSAESAVKFKYQNNKLNFYENEHVLPVVINGKAEVDCPDGLLGVENLKRGGKQALYRGSFEIVRTNGKFNLVNSLEVEDYLKGVVPNEMPVAFGLEALKAQSVAARNYVLSPRAKSSVNYDVVDSVASQVYFGANTEKPLSNQAIKESEGVVALYDGALILAQYSSTAGGYTESYSNAFSDPVSGQFPSTGKPYLVGVPDIPGQTPLKTEEAASAFYKSKPDSFDIRSSYFRWTREWTPSELEKTLNVKGLREIRVKSRGESGKIVELEIVADSGGRCVCKELVIRRLITKNGTALPSANVVFEHTYDTNGKLTNIRAYGGGYGHGVGMSQYGAGYMGSELKMSYDKILKHYYSNITLGTTPVNVGANEVTQNFYANKKSAKIILNNKSNVNCLITNINGKEYVFELVEGFLGHKRINEIDISQYIKSGRNTMILRLQSDEASKKSLQLYVELE